MRIAVFGAGAVGGFFGAKLARAGEEVFFIARGDHLAAIKREGLRIESKNGDFTVEAHATDDPGDVGEVELVVLTVKSQGTPAALESMGPLVGDDTGILSLQNGIENEDMIAGMCGVERTLGGVSYIASEVIAPGVIRHSGLGRIALGEWPHGRSERIERIARVFEGAGIPAKVEDDISIAMWRKLIWNASFNPVSVVLGRDSAALSTMPESREVISSIMREVLSVAGACGPSIDEEIVERTLELTANFPGAKTSMQQDYERGKDLEIDALLGVIVRKGMEQGVPIPVSRTVYELVKFLGERGKTGTK